MQELCDADALRQLVLSRIWGGAPAPPREFASYLFMADRIQSSRCASSPKPRARRRSRFSLEDTRSVRRALDEVEAAWRGHPET